MKETLTIQFTDDFKYRMLSWANRFNIFCFLDNCGYTAESGFDVMLAAGCRRSVSLDDEVWDKLAGFHDASPSWLFGHLGYEAGSGYSGGDDRFNNGFFFEPEILLRIAGDQLTILTDYEPGKIMQEINSLNSPAPGKNNMNISALFSRQEYLERLKKVKEHIHRGDCYELNFCQEFSGEGVIDPVDTYLSLTRLSPNPFAALYRMENSYCICASPERFLRKDGDVLRSQPIKGTSKRYNEPGKDKQSFEYLRSSEKERSENIMVVDLVRNDLGRVSVPGTVIVRELCGIYAFPQVYQMISTIEGKLRQDKHWTEAIKDCFPMGSMTGAPKKRVMELIREYEANPRGLFSGTIGYITPGSDFDFNVVIRSIFYNAEKNHVSYLAGGGITFGSDPAEEYNESLVKAAAIKNILED